MAGTTRLPQWELKMFSNNLITKIVMKMYKISRNEIDLTDYSRNEVRWQRRVAGGVPPTCGERVRDIGARAPQQTAYWTCYVGVCAAMYQHKHRYEGRYVHRTYLNVHRYAVCDRAPRTIKF